MYQSFPIIARMNVVESEGIVWVGGSGGDGGWFWGEGKEGK